MKVAIVGFAEKTRNLAPWDDPSWQIWGVNGTWKIARRLDVLLDLHAPWIYEWETQRRPLGHVAHMRTFDGPVYLIEPREDVPTSRRYPLDAVVQYIGRPYLTSSIAMAVALAALQNATTIGLYGVEMAQTTEYAEQRPGLEWLLGWLEARGVDIVLPTDCNLLSGPVYGRSDLRADGTHLVPRQFDTRIQTLLQRQRELQRQAARIDGALAETALYENPSAAERTRVLSSELADVLEVLARVDGMVSEARYWAAQTPSGAPQIAVMPTVPALTLIPQG